MNIQKITAIIISILFAVAFTSFNYDSLTVEDNKISFILILIGTGIFFISKFFKKK